MSDTMPAVVADGVAAFCGAEQSCDALYSAIHGMPSIITRGQALNMAGALASDTLRADLLTAAGKIAEAKGIIMRAHTQCTTIAQNNNVDVPAPNSGGTR